MATSFGPVHPMKARIVDVLRTRGLAGLLEVFSELASCADPQTGSLGKQALTAGLRAGGLAIAAADASDLFDDLDESSCGSVPLFLVIRYILGRPSAQRQALLQHLFLTIDTAQQGAVTPAQIMARFRAGSHPDVRAARLSTAQVQRDTRQALHFLTGGSQSVDLDAFTLFQSALAAFADDADFAGTVAACWAAPRAATSAETLCAPLMSGPSATSHALDKVRHTVLSRGVRGIAGLQRQLCAADAEGSGTLTREQFRKAAFAAALGLGDIDVEQLLVTLGTHRSISIPDLMHAITGELSAPRQQCVAEAFAALAAGAEAVPVGQLLARFRPAQHPAVVRREATAAEVRTQFLEGFDISGEVEGCATRADFVKYYTHLSAVMGWQEHGSSSSSSGGGRYYSSNDDAAFADIVRGTWGLSAGVGAEVARRNSHPAVYEQEQQQDDRSSAGMHGDEFQRQQQQQQQYDAGQSSAAAASTASSAAPVALSAYDAAVARAGARGALPSPPPAARIRAAATNASLSGYSAAAQSELAGSAAAANSRGSGIPFGLQTVLQKLKAAVHCRGVRGVAALNRALRSGDAAGSGRVTLAQFKQAVHTALSSVAPAATAAVAAATATAGTGSSDLTETELRMLHQHLDTEGTGAVAISALQGALRTPLSARRAAAVAAAFSKLHAASSTSTSSSGGGSSGGSSSYLTGLGLIDAVALVTSFNAAAHPAAAVGTRSEASVRKDFLEAFECGADVEGHVSEREFVRFYEGVSACCDAQLSSSGRGSSSSSDAEFEAIVCGCWGVTRQAVDDALAARSSSGSAGSSSSLAPVTAGVVVTLADGARRIEQVPATLAAEGDIDRLIRCLRLKGVPAVDVAVTGASSSNSFDSYNATGSPVVARKPLVLPEPAAAHMRPGRYENTVPPREADFGLLSIITALRAAVSSRGVRGWVGLRRALRAAADVTSDATSPVHHVTSDATRRVSLSGLKRAAAALGLTAATAAAAAAAGTGTTAVPTAGAAAAAAAVTDTQLRLLWQHLDSNSADSVVSTPVTVARILGVLRPAVPQRRAALCGRAFAVLEQRSSNSNSNNSSSSTGVVRPAAVADSFCADRHPAVLAGRCSAQEAVSELLECLEVSAVEGVTRQDFLEYCACCSAVTPSDEQFSALIKQCWGLANSSDVAAAGSGSANSTAAAADMDAPVRVRRRVVATHSDGTQEVLEVIVSAELADDTEALKKAAAEQGASDVRFLYTTNRPPEESDLLLQLPPPSAATANAASGGTGTGSSRAGPSRLYKLSKPSAAAGVLPGTLSLQAAARAREKVDAVAHNRVRPRGVGTATTATAATYSSAASRGQPDSGLLTVLCKARAALLQREGVRGMASAHRALQAADSNGDGLLTLGEFKQAMNEAETGLTEAEQRMLYQYLDPNTAGFVPSADIMALLRAPLSARRAACVRSAYAALLAQAQSQQQQQQQQQQQPQHKAVLQVRDLLALYRADCHPEVVAGRSDAQTTASELTHWFSAAAAATAAVSAADFEAYYCDLGAGIASDDYFELLVRSCWGLPPSQASRAATAGMHSGTAATTSAYDQHTHTIGAYPGGPASPCRHSYHAKPVPQPLGMVDHLADRLLPHQPAPAAAFFAADEDDGQQQQQQQEEFQFAERGTSSRNNGSSGGAAAAAAPTAKPTHAAGGGASKGRSVGSSAIRTEQLTRMSRSQISFGGSSAAAPVTTGRRLSSAHTAAAAAAAAERHHHTPHVRYYEDHLIGAAPLVSSDGGSSNSTPRYQRNYGNGSSAVPSASAKSLAQVAAAAAAAREQQQQKSQQYQSDTPEWGGAMGYLQQQQQQLCNRGAASEHSGAGADAGDWPLVTGRRHFVSEGLKGWGGTGGGVIFHRPATAAELPAGAGSAALSKRVASPTWTSSIVLG